MMKSRDCENFLMNIEPIERFTNIHLTLILLPSKNFHRSEKKGVAGFLSVRLSELSYTGLGEIFSPFPNSFKI